jgi:hypothetical protein
MILYRVEAKLRSGFEGRLHIALKRHRRAVTKNFV